MTYTIKDSLSVRVDGIEISKDNYTVDENTGAVTLTEEYKKTLAAGDHTLTVILSDNETTKNFTIAPVVYKVTEGSGAEWAKNSGNTLSFRTDAEPGTFSSIMIDGKETAAGNYAVSEDGTVSLKDSFLKTLDEGEHELTLVFTNGKATATFMITGSDTQTTVSPQPGSDSQTVIWVIVVTVCVIAVAAVVVILVYRRKNTQKK